MSKLNDKIVLITGASSGIGKACAEQFAAQGARLILAARRTERIQKLAEDLKNKYKTEVLSLQLDVQKKDQVFKIIQDLPAHWEKIDVLLNNAGLALGSDKMQDGDIDNWDTMIHTNVNGLLYVTRAVLPGMVERNQGHIINIGSVAGHDCYPTGNVYCATKHAVNAISKSLRLDLLGTAIRVTEVDPGAVYTEFSDVRWKDAEKAKNFYAQFTPLIGDDIADAVLYCATRPPHVDIAQISILPTDQASINHLHKKGQVDKGLFD